MALRPEQLVLWRKRLRWAKDVWIKHGLIGTREPSRMRVLIELNRGNQWAEYPDGWAGLGARELVTSNKIFPISNSVLGQIAARNPEIQIHPTNRDERITSVVGVEQLINRDLQELRWQRQTNDVLADHLFAPMGILRHGFTPSEEWENDDGTRLDLYGRSKRDRPWVRREPIWNVLLDPQTTRFHSDSNMRWCAFRTLMTLEQIKQNPNMKNRDGLDAFAGNVNREFVQMMPRNLQELHAQDPDQDQLVEVWTVYEKEDRTWFQLTLDGPEKPLRDEQEWPIQWEELPVSILAINEQRDTPMPLSLLDQLIEPQIELNKVVTMISHLSRQLRRVVFVNDEMLHDGEADKLFSAELLEFIKTRANPNEVMAQVQLGGLPGELITWANQIEEQMRQIVGQSLMGRGQRINVETASEVERVQQGQDVHTGRIAAGFEAFNEHAVRLYMQARRETMQITGAEQVRNVGQRNAQGIQEWLTVSPEDMAGDFEIQVTIGSTRPKDHARDAQQAAIDLQIAQSLPQSVANVPASYRKYLEARLLDPLQLMRPGSDAAGRLQAVDEVRRTLTEEGAATPDPAAAAAAIQSLGGNGTGT